MKPRSIKPWYFMVALFITATALLLISWDRKPDISQFRQSGAPADTIPKKKNNSRDRKVRDLDEALQELEDIDLKIDMEKAMAEVNKAMKEVDFEKIKLDIDKAMKEVDFEKIQAEVNKSMKEVDFEKIKLDIDKAMKEVDFEKINREVKESLAKVDWDKIKVEMEEIKKIDLSGLEADMKKVKEELKDIKPQIEKEMAKARVEIEKAKVELKEYKEFVDGLEKDGLLIKKEPYSIKHKNGELIVNDKKVSDQTYSKYRSFLEKHSSFTIKKDEDDFNIDMD